MVKLTLNWSKRHEWMQGLYYPEMPGFFNHAAMKNRSRLLFLPALALPALASTIRATAATEVAAPEKAAPLRTGNGKWTYELATGWGAPLEGNATGPTHGGVAIDQATGHVFASTDSGSSLLVYDKDGKLIETIAPELEGLHALISRQEDGKTVFYGAQLNAYGNPNRKKAGKEQTPIRVVKFDTTGKILLEISQAKNGDIQGGWGGLTGLTVAPDGSIFCSMGYASQLIHKFDASGKLLKSFGGKGKGDLQTSCSHGLAIDTRYGAPRLLVVDRENYRIFHTDLEGNWIGVYATNLRRPCNVSFHGDHCAVAELQGRVTILDKAGTPVAFLGDNPNDKQWANFDVPAAQLKPGLFTAPHGLTFDSQGNLFIEEWNTTGRITKLTRIA